MRIQANYHLLRNACRWRVMHGALSREITRVATLDLPFWRVNRVGALTKTTVSIQREFVLKCSLSTTMEITANTNNHVG